MQSVMLLFVWGIMRMVRLIYIPVVHVVAIWEPLLLVYSSTFPSSLCNVFNCLQNHKIVLLCLKDCTIKYCKFIFYFEDTKSQIFILGKGATSKTWGRSGTSFRVLPLLRLPAGASALQCRGLLY